MRLRRCSELKVGCVVNTCSGLHWVRVVKIRRLMRDFDGEAYPNKGPLVGPIPMGFHIPMECIISCYEEVKDDK